MQPSDKELDKLAGEAAENLEAPGAVPDWDAMSALLETELPEKEDRRRRPILWFILLLFLGAGGYFFINSSGDPANKQVATNTNKTGSTNDNTKPSTREASTTSVPSTQTIIEKNIEELVTSPDLNSTAHPAAENPTSYSRRSLSKQKAASLKVSTITGNVGEVDAQTSDKNNIPPAKDSTRAATEPPANIAAPADQLTPAVPLASIAAGQGNSKQTKTAVATSTDSSAPTSRKKAITKKQRARYEISVLYAPELTTIGFSDFDKPGSSFGLLAGYHISDRVMVQTGFIKSKKNYTAAGEDYKLHYQVPSPYKLAEVTGYCHMYEVPLNVKYQITNSKKINTAVIAGLSSYFMTEESYVYKYTSSYNSYDRNVHDDTQKNYWFSLATLGVGFETDLTKSIKAGATPYIKIPFQGMGTGELKLTSIGINFTVTYRPTFTR